MLKLLFLILHSSYFFNPFALLSNVVQKGILSQKNFPIGNFPRVFSECAISQAATSQRLGPLRRRRLQLGHSAGARMGQEVKRHGQNRLGPSAAALTDLGSCRSGNHVFGNLPLGKIPPPFPHTHISQFLQLCQLFNLIIPYYIRYVQFSSFIYIFFYCRESKINDFPSIFFLFWRKTSFVT